jgi:hypothetical protein
MADKVVPMPYVKLQQSGDEATAPGGKYFIKGGFVQKTSDALVDVIMATVADAKLPMVQLVSMQPAGGAIGRVAPRPRRSRKRGIQFNMFVLAPGRTRR